MRELSKHPFSMRCLGPIVIAISLTAGMLAAAAAPSLSRTSEDGDRDKTGTTAIREAAASPQTLEFSGFLSGRSFVAGGMGLEPPIHFGTPDFEAGRWPIRLPPRRTH